MRVLQSSRIVAAAALSFCWSGCQHRVSPPESMPGMMALPGLAMPGLAITAPQLRTRAPDLTLDPKWLDLDEFFPPGARRVGPNNRLDAELAGERRTRFPTTELCPSPDNRYVLFHDGTKRRNDIYHWLMLLKHDAPYPNPLFITPLAFDASWSEDSRRFAITHFVGDNSSEVFTVEMTDLSRRPIDVRPILEEHFPPHVVGGPMFLKAYRWTRDGQLVVRGIGRAREPPHELFGCEVAIAFDEPTGEPRTRFLRGYIKAQDEN